MNTYLNPLEIPKTYYAFEFIDVHFVAIDLYVNYGHNSAEYKFIEKDLKNAVADPKIDWIFVIEHRPIYTSPSKHPADSTIRDIFHLLIEEDGVEIVFSGDNHNYQKTLYNDNGDSSDPLLSSTNMNYYKENSSVIALTTGTACKSHYELEQQNHILQDMMISILDF